MGHAACGKTTLCQCLNGLEQVHKKTQALEVVHHTIDSPGEYMERRSLLSALVVASVEADLVLFLQDASQERFLYSQGQSAAFPVPVAGVITKADAATPAQISRPGNCWNWQGPAPSSRSAPAPARASPSFAAFWKRTRPPFPPDIPLLYSKALPEHPPAGAVFRESLVFSQPPHSSKRRRRVSSARRQ